MSFLHLDRGDAELELVGAAVTNVAAIEEPLQVLPPDFFRGRHRGACRRAFYGLLGRYLRGRYDPASNETYVDACVAASWLQEYPGAERSELRAAVADYRELMFCPGASSEQYVLELVGAIAEDERLTDNMIKARSAWLYRNPLALTDLTSQRSAAREAEERPQGPSILELF